MATAAIRTAVLRLSRPNTADNPILGAPPSKWCQKSRSTARLCVPPLCSATDKLRIKAGSPIIMDRKTILIVGGALVLAAFLLGFIPEYVKTRDLNKQMDAVQQQLNSEREKSQMEALGLLCGYIYLETNLKNYGLASQYSTQFFDRVRVMMGQQPDSNRQAFLQTALAKRDLVTAGLAKGDPGTLAAVQNLFYAALESTRTESK